MNIFTLQKLREQYDAERNTSATAGQSSTNFINTQIGTISGGVVITGGQNEIHVTMNEKGQIQHVDAIDISDRETPTALSAQLSGSEAMAIWEKLQSARLIDHYYQPLVNKVEAALIAAKMADILNLEHRWTYFEQLWNRKNMRNDYQRALESAKTRDFLERLNSIL